MLSILLFIELEFDTGTEVYEEYHVLYYSMLHEQAMKENVDMGTAILKYLYPEQAEDITSDETSLFDQRIRVAKFKETTTDTVRFLRTYVNINTHNVTI